MKIVAKTDIGLKRESNQDSYAAGELPGSVAWAVVCDGMGGHEGGKTASELAVQTFLAQYAESHLIAKQTDMLIDTAKKTDTMIFQLKNEQGDLLKAGSTLAGLQKRR